MMVRALAALAAAVALCASAAIAQSEVKRAIDPAASKALFSVTHVYVEHVTGTVPIAGGTVTLSGDSLVPVAVTARLDPTRMKTGEDERDGVLQTSDWFDTKAFPVWTFTSTKIVPQGGNRFTMDGDLTVHGITRSVRLEVGAAGTPAHPVYHATGELDRHAFGMSVTRLDPVIGSPVAITLDIALQ